MDKSKESTDNTARRLQEISKGILTLKDVKNCQADLFDVAGRFVKEALDLGAFNRPEHITLRKHTELRLSHKDVNPYISAWGEIVLWLKYKKPPFPPSEDIAKNFSADCEIFAKAILDEVEAIQKKQQPEPTSSETEQNTTPAKCLGIWTRIKKIFEKGWQIFTKSFWEVVLDRVWHK